MSSRSEQEVLLEDVLGTDLYEPFREALLEQTLAEVQRRRRGKKWRMGMATAVVLIGALSVTFRAPRRPELHESPALQVVRTQPLDSHLVVESRADPALVVSSSALSLAVVETSLAPQGFREIDDEQLLEFFAGRPVMLVRQNATQAELVFLNPEDRESDRH